MRLFSMVVEWSSSGQILYEIIFTLWQVKVLVNSFVRHFYENIQSAWESAHQHRSVKQTMDAYWRQCKSLSGGRVLKQINL